MDNFPMVQEEPLQESANTIIKEELIIEDNTNYECEDNTKLSDPIDDVVEDEDTDQKLDEKLKVETLLDHGDTIIKEELIIEDNTNYECEDNTKVEPLSDPIDDVVEDEDTNQKLDENLKVETFLDHGDSQESVAKGRSNVSCDLCDFKASFQGDIQNHYLRDHVIGSTRQHKPTTSSSAVKKNKKYKCPQCDYRSHLPAHVKRHSMIHTGETPYGCTKCEFKTRDTSTLKRHIRTQHDNKTGNKPAEKTCGQYICHLCKFTARDKRWLTRHQMTSHDMIRSRYECPHCEFRCMQKYTFTNHVLLHNGIASHPCQLCDYKTNIPTELRKHMLRAHTDTKPFECTECNYKTKSRSDLCKHSVVHKNVRPYSCSLCHYKCKRRSHLVAHQSVHDKAIGLYTCPFCKFKTINISCLKIHVRKHTGEKPYECDQCDEKYSSIAGLKAHAFFSHVENWSQSCPLCKFTTNKPFVFKSHVKSHDGSYRRKKKRSVSEMAEDATSSD